jgi:hypothetical protein
MYACLRASRTAHNAGYVLPDGSVLEGLTANKGIAQGYFAHSPTCVLHPGLSH